MLLISDVATVPVPLETAQLNPTGWACTVTLYVDPEATVVGKVKVVAFAAELTVSAPLASTRPDAESPAIVPPTWNLAGMQVTATEFTSVLPTVPDAADTVQLRPGGCVLTLTL